MIQMIGRIGAVLALGLFTAGCLTLSADKKAALTDATIVAQICSYAWKEISYDSYLDTPLTVEEVRQGNAARNAFCNGTLTIKE